jgi:signal transduction histidine kinase
VILLGRRRPPPADALLAAALLVVGESQVWLGWHDGGVGEAPQGHQGARALVVAVSVLPLAWRRLRPVAAGSAVCLALVVQLIAVTPYVPFLAGLLPLAVVNYTAAAYGGRVRVLVPLLVAITQSVIYARIPQERTSGEVLFSLFVLLGTWVAGDVVRARSTRAERALGTAQVLVQRTAHEAATALAEERGRIARELHDVVAHSVALMGVQAGAARMLMDVDPAAARDSLRSVEATARSSVDELQRLLTVLREGDAQSEQHDRAPQPGLALLPALVEQVRAAGLPVTLADHRSGGSPLPPGLDLTAFRVVQEALTNALKHAGTPTTVRVLQHVDELVIEVRDHGRGAWLGAGSETPGHGLVGMRERVQLYGGTLHTGPDGDGFRVRAVLPLVAAPAVVSSS